MRHHGGTYYASGPTMNQTQPSPAQRQELPDEPGHWTRESGGWQIVVRRHPHFPEMPYTGWCGDNRSHGVISDLPHDGWLKAQPASEELRASGWRVELLDQIEKLRAENERLRLEIEQRKGNSGSSGTRDLWDLLDQLGSASALRQRLAKSMEDYERQLAAAQSRNTAFVEALRELVAVKDLKDRIDRIDPMNYRPEPGEIALREEYASRKPPAWKAARAALAGTEAGQGCTCGAEPDIRCSIHGRSGSVAMQNFEQLQREVGPAPAPQPVEQGEPPEDIVGDTKFQEGHDAARRRYEPRIGKLEKENAALQQRLDAVEKLAKSCRETEANQRYFAEHAENQGTEDWGRAKRSALLHGWFAAELESILTGAAKEGG